MSNLGGKAVIAQPKPAPEPVAGKRPGRWCIECKHWDFDPGTRGWETTPGDNWSSECRKRHWYLYGYDVYCEQWRETIRKAETCADFDEVAW